MEEIFLHIGVPDEHMAADADVVLLRPGNHGVRTGIGHAGHAVFGGFAGIFVQQGIGLGFVAAGQGIEMTGQEVHKDRVSHIIVAERTAEFETVGLCQGPERFVILRDGTGLLSYGRERKQADDQRKRETKDFQKVIHRETSSKHTKTPGTL